MGDLLGNLVFVVVAILAWVVKEAMERKEAKQAQQKRGERTGAPGPATDKGSGTGEVDVVYGRRKLPDALTAPPVDAEALAPMSAPAPTTAAGPTRTSGGGRFGTFTGHGLETHIATTATSTAFTRDRRAHLQGGWTRLGVAPGTRRRDVVRAGVLWSEVLGAPRAHAGPHRSPAQKRMRRGR